MFDVGEQDGLPYISMEYVDGPTLAQWLERNPRLPVMEAVAIGRQLAAALGFAKGSVHRDVKPGRVMLVHDTQTVKVVADFGICRIAGGEDNAGNACRRRARHPPRHGARAGSWTAGRQPLGRLLHRHRAVPDAHRRVAIHR